MRGMPAGFPGPTGTTWVAQSSARYRTTGDGLLRRIGDDDPTAAYQPGVAWEEFGPLVPAPRLAAAYRRSAHELQCSPNGMPPVEAAEYADWLLTRAEQVSQP